MNIINPLESLTYKQLNTILKHVRLGKDHLTRYLSDDDLKELLKNGDLKETQKDNLRTDIQEKTGNIVLVLNTIITSFIGGWLGLAGFSHLNLQSSITIIILFASIIVGGIVGYLSYQLTKRQANDAIFNQKLRNIEVQIINILFDKRKKSIEHAEQAICDYVNLFLEETDLPATPKNIHEILLANRNNILKNKLFSYLEFIPDPVWKKYYTQTLEKIFSSIERIAKKLEGNENPQSSKVAEKTETTFSSGDMMLNTSLTNASYVKILTKPDLPAKKMVPKPPVWFKKNILAIAVGLMPTMLGGFASMFVFLDGVPNIFKEFNLSTGVDDAYIFYAKMFSLSLAVLITLYFGYSHIHTNFKAFKRTKQLEMTENVIDEKSDKLVKQTLIHYAMTKLKYRLGYLDILYQNLKFLKKLTRHKTNCEI
jgi:hypothetical protein